MKVNVLHYDSVDGDSITLGVHESFVTAQEVAMDRINEAIRLDKRIYFQRNSTKTTITFWVVDLEAASHNEGRDITVQNLSVKVAKENWIERYTITQVKVKA